MRLPVNISVVCGPQLSPAVFCMSSLPSQHSDACILQVIEESAARAANASDAATPSKAAPAAAQASDSDAARELSRELADVKKRFLAVAKKKQADYAKKARAPVLACARVVFPDATTCPVCTVRLQAAWDALYVKIYLGVPSAIGI